MNYPVLKHGAVVLTAPSGAGKTTLARRIMEALPQLTFSISATTRPPRDYEEDGVHYYFISEDEFVKRIEAGDFMEYEEVYPGLFYGTLVSEIQRIDAHGPVLLDVDVRGAHQIKQLLGSSCVSIFIRPPSMDELKARLLSRGTESEEDLLERLNRSEMEMEYADKSDYVVVNDHLDDTVEETLGIVRKFLRSRKDRFTLSNSSIM